MIDVAAATEKPPAVNSNVPLGHHTLSGSDAPTPDGELALARLAARRVHNRHGCAEGCIHPRHYRDVQDCLWALRMLGLKGDE